VKDILSLKLYTRVARLGSFSAASREFGLSQSQVSRIIADLESDLGARLLTRTTRAVVLTDAGAEFLSRLDPILMALEDAEQSVREGSELRGILRMSMPSSIAIRHVIPRVAPFLARHPELRLHVLLGDRPQDLVKDAVDVAIRLGRLVDSSATATLITQIQRVIVASPGGPASVVPAGWRFARAGEEVVVDLEAIFSTDENEGAVAAAAAGIGITSTSEWACRRELDEGSLVRLLVDWKTADIPVHAYFPMGRATRAAGRAVVEHLMAEFRRGQYAASPSMHPIHKT
jgi:DNA-binding transcriptional LysR family regulator